MPLASRATAKDYLTLPCAFEAIFGNGAWAGKLVAAAAVVSGIGALNGWTLVTAETSRAVADDGLFPRFFSWADRKDTAWFGILLAAILPSLLMLWSYNTKTDLTVFTYLVDLTVVTVAIPYLMSACAQLTYLVSRRRRVEGWRATCRSPEWLRCSRCGSPLPRAGRPSTRRWSWCWPGVIIYAFVTAWRERTGQVPEPVDVAPEDEGAAVTAPAVTEPHHRHLRILGNGGRHTDRSTTEAGP